MGDVTVPGGGGWDKGLSTSAACALPSCLPAPYPPACPHPTLLPARAADLLVLPSCLAPPQVVKRLWAYIKENGLQDPKDKRVIIFGGWHS